MESKQVIPKASLKKKLLGLKQSIINNLNYNSNYVSEDVISSFVKEVVVNEDKYDWKLNYLSEIVNENNIYSEKSLENCNGIFLTRIIVTKDDVERFLANHTEHKCLKLKNPLKIDIYL